MSLIRSQQRFVGTPVALTTLVCFLCTLFTPLRARADAPASLDSIPNGTGETDVAGPSTEANTPTALATVDVATGAAHANFSFELPSGRGDTPSLSIQYNSAWTTGRAGVGWDLGLPSIVRRGASGIPLFEDPELAFGSPLEGPDTDEYFVDGRLLVPVAVLSDNFTGLPTGETMPTFVTSVKGPVPWVYYRTEVDDGHRYFFNGSTWVMQTKEGHFLQFGQPLDNAFPPSIEQADAVTAANNNHEEIPTQAYRWNLVRDTDATGNTTYIVWDDEHQLFSPSSSTAGNLYPTDIYYTLPPGAAPVASAFAHHVHLTWSLAQYPSGLPKGTVPTAIPYAASPIWRAVPTAQLAFVDVTSALLTDPQRHLVRSYSLFYTQNATQTRSYLFNIQQIGNCQSSIGPVFAPVVENAAGLVRNASNTNTPHNIGNTGSGCAGLPNTSFTYYGVNGPALNSPTLTKSSAFRYTGGFRNPPRMLDLNGDAVADLIFTDTSGNLTVQYGGGATVNGQATAQFAPNAAAAFQRGVLADWAANGTLSVLACVGAPVGGTLQNSGGTISLGPLNLPANDLAQACASGSNTSQADPGNDFDVDGDGYPDSVFNPSVNSIGLAYQAIFTRRDHTGAVHPYARPTNTYSLSVDTAYAPPGFNQASSTEMRAIADLDGDGLGDLVVANKFGATTNHGTLDFLALPNRGDGRFGQPDPGGASFGGIITLPLSTQLVGPDRMQDSTLRFGDLNGDGFADYALLDSSGVSVCVRNGASWDTATWQCTTDPSMTSSGNANIEIADLDGSGVRQVVYFPNTTDSTATLTATAISVAPNGSQVKDGLLQSMSNGFGATTSFHYVTNVALTSTASAQSRAGIVAGPLPLPAWVVDNVTTTNGLGQVGNVAAPGLSSSLFYRQAIFDPRDRIFVGYRTVYQFNAGGLGAVPTLVTRSYGTSACTDLFSPCGTPSADTSGFHALRGLLVIETTQEYNPNAAAGTLPAGNAFVTNWRESRLSASPYTALNDRTMLVGGLFRDHQYLWNASQAVATNFNVHVSSVNENRPRLHHLHTRRRASYAIRYRRLCQQRRHDGFRGCGRRPAHPDETEVASSVRE
jgi:hypothetical protein